MKLDHVSLGNPQSLANGVPRAVVLAKMYDRPSGHCSYMWDTFVLDRVSCYALASDRLLSPRRYSFGLR